MNAPRAHATNCRFITSLKQIHDNLLKTPLYLLRRITWFNAIRQPGSKIYEKTSGREWIRGGIAWLSWLLTWLWRNLQPALRTVFHIGIVAFRISAIVPVIGTLSLWRHLHDPLLLDIDRRSGRNGDNRCISIIRRISCRRIAIRRWIRGAAPIIAQTITQ